MESESSAPLFSLVYTSTAAETFSDEDLSDLLRTSRERNHGEQITGMLLYRNGRFVQFLEGEEASVRALYARIAADPRHTMVRLLVDGHPAQRTFEEWSMGYEPLRRPTGPPPEGFRDSFDDVEHAESSDAVVRALQELSIWFRHRADRGGSPLS